MLTAEQRMILNFLASKAKTVREDTIADELSLDPTATVRALHYLRKSGLVETPKGERNSNQWRLRFQIDNKSRAKVWFLLARIRVLNMIGVETTPEVAELMRIIR